MSAQGAPPFLYVNGVKLDLPQDAGHLTLLDFLRGAQTKLLRSGPRHAVHLVH